MDQVAPGTKAPLSRGTGWALVTAAALALLFVAAYWYVAVPRALICPAIHPAPPGCGAHRVPAAWVWTAVAALGYGALTAAGLTAGRQRPRWVWRAVVVLVLVLIVGYRSVLYATGFFR